MKRIIEECQEELRNARERGDFAHSQLLKLEEDVSRWQAKAANTSNDPGILFAYRRWGFQKCLWNTLLYICKLFRVCREEIEWWEVLILQAKQNMKPSLLDVGRVRNGFRGLNQALNILVELEAKLQCFHSWFVKPSRNNEVDHTVSINLSFARIEKILGKM